MYKRYTHKPVSPLTKIEAPCFGSGLLGICLLNYSLHILIFNNQQIPHFSIFQNLTHSPPPLILIR